MQGYYKKVVHILSVDTLLQPEYYQKEEIEGRREQVLKGLQENGTIAPILVNRHPGRENIIIDGWAIVGLCKELGITEVPALVYDLPLEQEKEFHYLLNIQTSYHSKETIIAILDAKYAEYFKSKIALSANERAMIENPPHERRTKMTKSAAPVTAHFTEEEMTMLEKAKNHFSCQSTSQVIKEVFQDFIIRYEL